MLTFLAKVTQCLVSRGRNAPSDLKRLHSLWAGGNLHGGKGREMQCVDFDPA